MIIQHNIMAMNAYRNYKTNTSALSANLEKLSSGYKINRAGDDAAGLAISEKMRAQITGLEAAQKNVKDGVSLVKTAEGAMQEIQDMLNRMDYLATQSANGTYDNEVDRAALQKEVDQLKSEINRIADSANFNGIKLLDGSLDSSAVSGATYEDKTATELQALFVNGFTDADWKGTSEVDVVGGKNVLETEGGSASKAGFQISLDGTTAVLHEGEEFTLKIGNQSITTSVGVDGDPKTLTSTELAKELNGKTIDITDSNGKTHTFTASASGNVLTFTTEDKDDFTLEKNASVSWEVEAPANAAPTGKTYTAALDDDMVTVGNQITIGSDTIKIAAATDEGNSEYSLDDLADGVTVGNYTVSYSNGTLTMEDADGTAGAPGSITYGAANDAGASDTTALTDVDTGNDGKADYSATLTTTDDEITVDSTKIEFNNLDPDGSDVTTSPQDTTGGDYTYEITFDEDAGSYTVTFTAKSVGTSNDSDTVSGTVGGVAIANGTTVNAGNTQATSASATFDLTNFANAAATNENVSITVNGTEYAWKGNLADTVTQIQDNDFTFTLNADGKTLEIEAKNAVDNQSIANDGDVTISWSDGSSKTATATEVADSDSATSYGTINSGLQNVTDNNSGASAQLANTVVNFDNVGAWSDGAKITIGDTTYTVAVGEDSKFKGANNVVDLTDLAAKGIAPGGDGTFEKFAAERLTVAAKDNSIFTVGHDGAGNTTLQQKSTVKDTTDMTTKEKVAGYLGVSLANPDSLVNAQAGKGLTLQIGDTSDSYNQLAVNVGDMHVSAMGIDGIDIGTQDGAAAAIATIRSAINYVSSVRGDLGATQNRLEHTANNLSVMAENITDAESTIRDTDVAEEMMSYVKNNILVQSAQAMLAQANQVPQGVLQLLG